MVRMTFDEYDNLCEELTQIPNEEPAWYPEITDIDQYAVPHFDKYCEFLIWLTETCNAPATDEDRKKYRYINQVLRDNLILYDEDVPEE